MDLISWQAFLVILTSAVKFFFAPLTSEQLGFSYEQTILLTTVGGWISTTCFYWSASWVSDWALRRRRRRVEQGKRKPPRNFTRMNKFIVRVKRSMGLFGIALVTPAIVSIPLGCIIAAKFFHHRLLTYTAICVSTLAWSVALSTVFYFIL